MPSRLLAIAVLSSLAACGGAGGDGQGEERGGAPRADMSAEAQADLAADAALANEAAAAEAADAAVGGTVNAADASAANEQAAR